MKRIAIIMLCLSAAQISKAQESVRVIINVYSLHMVTGEDTGKKI